MLEVLGLAAALGLLPAAIASAKGYSFWLWWFYGWMLFIVALPHALLLPNRKKRMLGAPFQGPGRWPGQGVGGPAPPPGVTPGDGGTDPSRAGETVSSPTDETRLAACPSCGEHIHADTALCPFCGWVRPT
ncbi:MAG: hypothetical protein J2P59_10550 [Acidimicrobiales bacterium]|nr:hypothetical protein [Acidimicrobiales bacterium]